MVTSSHRLAIFALAALLPVSESCADVAGFGGNGTNFTQNNTSVTGDALTLTNSTHTSGSIFYNTAQTISPGFQVSFTYQENGLALGSGAAFVIENSTAGKTAVNQSGTLLGGISPAAAVELNLTSLFAAAGSNSTYAYNNGTSIATTSGGSALSVLGATDPLNVMLKYNGSTLTEIVTDGVSGGAATTYTYNVGNLASALGGGGLAFIGFTGIAGTAATPTQTISGFSFGTVPEPAAWGPAVAGGLSLLTLTRLWRRQRRRQPNFFFGPSTRAAEGPHNEMHSLPKHLNVSRKT